MAVLPWRIIQRLMKRCGEDDVIPVSAPVSSSSQQKKQTHSLQWGLLGEDLVISPACEVGGCQFNSRKDQLRKGLDVSRDTSSLFLSSTINALEQSWLPDSQHCVASQVYSCGWDNRAPSVISSQSSV